MADIVLHENCKTRKSRVTCRWMRVARFCFLVHTFESGPCLSCRAKWWLSWIMVCAFEPSFRLALRLAHHSPCGEIFVAKRWNHTSFPWRFRIIFTRSKFFRRGWIDVEQLPGFAWEFQHFVWVHCVEGCRRASRSALNHSQDALIRIRRSACVMRKKLQMLCHHCKHEMHHHIFTEATAWMTNVITFVFDSTLRCNKFAVEPHQAQMTAVKSPSLD